MNRRRKHKNQYIKPYKKGPGHIDVLPFEFSRKKKILNVKKKLFTKRRLVYPRGRKIKRF
jgi:hypothetical protein